MSKSHELEKEILKHKNLYYQGKPEISDIEYDKLEDKLRKLNPKSEILNFVGSEYFQGEKVEHDKKMLSLNKTYKLDDLLKWAGKEKVISTIIIYLICTKVCHQKRNFAINL